MDIVKALRSRAEMSAKAMQLLALSKSERNQAAGDVGANYDGGTREQTVEWRAANEIERLRDALERIRTETRGTDDDLLDHIYRVADTALHINLST